MTYDIGTTVQAPRTTRVAGTAKVIDAGTVGVIVSAPVPGNQGTWYDVQWARAGYARWFMTSDQFAVAG